MADVQKNAFMLSSATLMIAPFSGSANVFDLNPTSHSVGMCKDVSVNVDSSTIDLTNGVAQALVESRKTGVQAMISATVFEYTAKNFMLANSLSTTPTTLRRGKLTASAAAGATSLSVTTDPLPGEAGITAVGDVPAGATLLVQSKTNPDIVFPTVASGATTGTGPFVIAIAAPYAVPSGMSFAVDDYVYVVDGIGVGQVDSDNLFSVKIAGTLANFNRPVVAVFPKVRITKGFQLSFTETEYGSMPWEMKPLLLSASEATTGRLAEVGARRPGLVYAA